MRRFEKLAVGLACAASALLLYCTSAALIPTGRQFIPDQGTIGRTLKLGLHTIREMHVRNIGYDDDLVLHEVTFSLANPGDKGRFFRCRRGAEPERLERTRPPADGQKYAAATESEMFEIGLKRLDPTLGPKTEIIGTVFFDSGRPMARCSDCEIISPAPEGLKRPLGIWIPAQKTFEMKMRCEFYRGAAPEYISFEGQKEKIDPRIRYDESNSDFLEEYEFKRALEVEK